MNTRSSWTETLQIGDIVLFEFPFKKGGGKIRTCVVAFIDPRTGEAVLAYGTGSFRPPANPEVAITLDRQLDWKAAGLRKATLFQVDRRVRVSLSDQRFQMRRHRKTPVLGRMPLPAADRLKQAYLALPEVTAEEERGGVHPKAKCMTASKSPRRNKSFLRRRRKPILNPVSLSKHDADAAVGALKTVGT
ncbi:hypothetical protein [Shimia thalassica]|uniref:hypothetical protein n=1 Tax=Shimia thalassica TaxID=1715693 RepID=UPI00273364A2|nr:hypothetical protein [Shimia thalassica]MDP2520838.1 hypothetical protein [Shimia thalassica]